MTFALTSVKAWTQVPAVPVANISKQLVRITFTAAATDLTVDLGTLSSTFYTDIAATQQGVDFKTLMTSIQAAAAVLSSNSELKSPQLYPRVKVASLSAVGQYQPTIVNKCPKFVLFTADGDTSYQLEIEWLIAAGFNGYTVN